MNTSPDEAFGPATPVPVPAIPAGETGEVMQPKAKKGCTGCCTNGCGAKRSGVNAAEPDKLKCVSKI